MAVPRAAYDSIKAAFPIGTRQMLKNLEDKAAEVRHTLSKWACLTLLHIWSRC